MMVTAQTSPWPNVSFGTGRRRKHSRQTRHLVVCVAFHVSAVSSAQNDVTISINCTLRFSSREGEGGGGGRD